jgi:hypothetical protein
MIVGSINSYDRSYNLSGRPRAPRRGGVGKRKRAGLQGVRQCQTQPNKGLELTAYSLRCALASGSSSGPALGAMSISDKPQRGGKP